MAFILNLETATKNCSVSLANDGDIVFIREFAGQGYSHAELLHVYIEEALKHTGIAYKDLSAIAVSQGPGSYTGLRIGTSAAKGFCYALGIPLIALDTLEILAKQAKINNGYIIPMLDARRMEVYSAIFDKDHNSIRETRAEVIDADSFADIKEPVYFIGDAQDKAKTVLAAGNFNFINDIVYPSSREMAQLSFDKYKINDTVDVAYFEPFYLKEFFLPKSNK